MEQPGIEALTFQLVDALPPEPSEAKTSLSPTGIWLAPSMLVEARVFKLKKKVNVSE